MKFKRIEPGIYESEDGRFEIEDLYLPGEGGSNEGLVSRTSLARWQVKDKSGQKSFTKKVARGRQIAVATATARTLAEAKKKVEELLSEECAGTAD